MDDLAEFRIELLCQVGVRLVIHDLLDAAVGVQLCLALSLVLLDVLLSLLVYGLLMEHVEGAVFVPWAHHPRAVVDFWGEEALARCAILRLAFAEDLAGRIQEGYLAPTDIANIVI